MWAYEGAVPSRYWDEPRPYLGQTVILMRKGWFEVSTPEKTMRGHAGDWVMPKQGKRRQRFSPDAEVLSIHLALNWLGGMPLFEWDPGLIVPASRFPSWEKRGRELEQCAARQFPDAREDMAYGTASLPGHCLLQKYFFAWLEVWLTGLAELGFHPSPLEKLDPRLRAALHTLDSQPLDSPYRARQVASSVGLSSSALNRLFLRQFGLTARDYFERRRLESARLEIRKSGLLKEVAFNHGFRSLAHFSEWFRRNSGVSPSEFRQR